MCVFPAGIGCFLVCKFKKIVNADLMKLRQGNQNLWRDHAFSAFVIGVCSLGNIDLFTDFRLRQVSIFS